VGTDDYGSRLLEQHAAKLAASAVSVEVANERDYRSADTKSALRSMGFGTTQQAPARVGNPFARGDR